jgi:hypothetical protein
MRKYLAFIQQNQLAVSIILFLVSFVVARLPYYTLVNLPYLYDDTPVYIGNVDELTHGGFGLRGLPLGYPVFLWLCKQISSDIVFVTYMQSIVTFATGILFLMLIKKSFENLLIPAALALSIFTSSLLFVHFETTILTECLFANAVVLSFGSLACVLTKMSTKRLLMFSASVAIVMLVRATGIFLVPIWLGVFGYVVYSTRSVKAAACFVAPLLLFYVSLAALRSISNTEQKSTAGLIPALATNTLSYITSDPDLPSHVNELIDSYVLPLQDPRQTEYIRNGKDVVQISGLYLLYQRYSTGFTDSLLAKNNGSYTGLNSDLKAIFNTALRKHPEDVFRFFEIQFIHYFDSFDYRRTSAYPFFESFLTCFRNARIVNYSQHQYNRTGYVGDWAHFAAPQFRATELQSLYDGVTNDGQAKLAGAFFSLHHKMYRNKYWVYAAAFFSVVSIWLSWKKTPKRSLALFVLLICISNLVYMVVVSVNVSMIRYNFPLHFAFYSTVLFGFALLLQALFSKRGSKGMSS